MANLTRTQWPLGWVPSQDDVNGNPEGLLRMDNLQQDELGALTIARGAQEIYGPFDSYIAAIWSKIGFAGASESIWVGLAGGSEIIRSLNGTFTDYARIAYGSDFPCFGDGFGYVFIFAGAARIKDNGIAGEGGLGLPLGLLVPGAAGYIAAGGVGIAPTVTVNDQVTMNLLAGGTWTLIQGDTLAPDGGTNNGCTANVSETTLEGQIICTFSAPLDTTNIGGGGPSSTPGNDTLSFVVNITPAYFTDIIVDFVLSPSPGAPSAVITDYYTYDFNVASDTQFVVGQDVYSTLSTTRASFTRCGTNSQLDWTKVTAIRVTAIALQYTSFYFQGATALGGQVGGLNGTYVYAVVNLSNNGIYQATSPISPTSLPVYVINGTATITPPPNFDSNPITSVQIFRMSVPSTSVQVGTTSAFTTTQNPDELNTFYLVGTTQPGVAFVDNVPDLIALQTNISPNQFLQSVAAIPGSIIGCVGPYFGLMLYITYQYIYLSDSLDPDSIDTRYIVKAFGDPTEQNLWLKELTNGVLILGTTKNLYEISGTLVPLPDGTIDVYIIPIGENYPPLSQDVAAANATIFYAAADGIRYTTGSNSQLLSPQLSLLFQGLTQHGFPPVAIYPNGQARYPIAIAHGKLFCSLPMQDGSRWCFIYNFVRQTFTVQYTDPICFHGTQTDRMLAGYGAGGSQAYQNNGLYDLEKQTLGGFYDDTGALLTGYSIKFLTVFDSNGAPRNRKNLFTLKIVADTGGSQVDVYLAQDGGSLQIAGSINCNGITTNFIPLYDWDQTPEGGQGTRSGPNNNFRIQVQLVDHNLVTQFRLEEITIEYDQYPEQLNYLVLQPSNLNSYSRKRVTAFAYVINTLGNSIVFTPIVDNVALTQFADTFSTLVKETHVSYFDTETIGTDISGAFIAGTGGFFEFYGINEQETVSEKLPVPCTFLVIPPDNYGVPNRKRHTSYKFQIITRGFNVTFTPIVDGVSCPPAIFNTTVKQTVEYFFPLTQLVDTDATAPGDVIGIDIGGTLESDLTQNPVVPFEFYGTIEPQTIEKLPDRLKYYRIPNTNFGNYDRKRWTSYAIVIDTYGQYVQLSIIIDGVIVNTVDFNTTGKTTYVYYFDEETIGTDIGGILQVLDEYPFEFYGLNLEETVSEKMPTPCEFLVIPPNNYGTPNRKRHTSYKFQINTRGGNVIFTPILDRVSYQPATFNTIVKQTVEYFFPISNGDVIGIDIGGTLYSENSIPFEYYGTTDPQTVEKLPDRLEFYRIPNTNLNSYSRKRWTSYAFVIDTYGKNVVLTVLIDGNAVTPTYTFSTLGKTTYIAYFDQETIGTDIGGEIQSNLGQPFEFYGLNLEETVSEKLPTPCQFLVIPPNNYGSPNRKRHTSYKFQIITRGEPVTFTPILDGVSYPTAIFNTTIKKTVEYFFPVTELIAGQTNIPGDVIGIDIGGTLSSNTSTPFEFYGVVEPQSVEKLPDRLEFLRIPNTNLEVAARKRIRTIPIVIDTYGSNVIFTPILDGVLQTTSTTFNTVGKLTAYHYFLTDAFPTDIGGVLSGAQPFEFYALGRPEDVEVLPVPKMYDQIGPQRFDKIGKLYTLRTRLISTGDTSIPYQIITEQLGVVVPAYDVTDSNNNFSGSIPVTPFVDEIWEVQLPHNINGVIFRIVLGPTTNPFHRYDMQIRVSTSGMETEAQWIPVK